MNIAIGKKIKALRAERAVTQEQLAVFLGVTPQAVSRWESQYAYPDIELLPAIADYFSVTTDELLGVRQDERELRLAEVKAEIARLEETGGTKDIIAFARRAAAEFPAEETIQLHLAESLQRLMFDEEAKPEEQPQAEAERIFLTLLDASRDMDVRCRAVQGLMSHASYWRKDDKRALEMADRLPAMENCREFARAWCVKNDEGLYLQKAIELGASYLAVNLKELALDPDLADDGAARERSIGLLQTACAVTRLIFGEDMMYHHEKIAYFEEHIAALHASLDHSAEALDALEEMLRHAETAAESRRVDHGRRFASPCVDAIVYTGTDENFPDDTALTVCERCLERLKDSRFDGIRKSERFRAVEQALARRTA